MRNTKIMKVISIATMIFFYSVCGYGVEVFSASDLATALKTSSAGATFTLGADIDCAGWTTVDGFSGTLDGKRYKITNLDAPLFGTITGDIAISNLVVKDANIVPINPDNTVQPYGILMNSATAANLTVEGVTFTDSTLRNSTKGEVGFVVGRFSVTGTASFKDCLVDDTCSFPIGIGYHA